jgi:ankyrin repeat protein
LLTVRALEQNRTNSGSLDEATAGGNMLSRCVRTIQLSVVLGGLILTGHVQGQVLTAVEIQDHSALAAALAAGHDLDERNEIGQTALLVAVWNDDLEAARQLIEAGADVNAKDAIEDSPFLVAGAHGRSEILKMTLEHGAEIESTNRFGGTAIIPAAEKGHPEAVSILIGAGANVDHVNRLGWTALLEAVILSDGGAVHQDIVKRLLDGGADKSIADRDGVTALEHAKRRGFSEMVNLLK